MSKIKFWPDKVAHTVDVEVDTGNAQVRFTLDIGESYEAADDLDSALTILAIAPLEA